MQISIDSIRLGEPNAMAHNMSGENHKNAPSDKSKSGFININVLAKTLMIIKVVKETFFTIDIP